MSDNPDIINVTAQSFSAVVIDGSVTQPVLVDFWAAWCGPCRAVAPVLEQLVKQHPGKLKVAKVDTDAEQALAAKYGIRSLPTMMLFKDGKAVEQIVGAQPLSALNAVIIKYLPRDSDRLLKEAAVARSAGDRARALSLLEEAHVAEPEDYRVHPDLAAVLIDDNKLDLATRVLSEIPARALTPEVARQQARLRFALAASNSPPLSELNTLITQANAPTAIHYQWAIRQIVVGEYSLALPALLQIVRTDRKYGDDAARKALIDALSLLPSDDSLVREYRTQLARALH